MSVWFVNVWVLEFACDAAMQCKTVQCFRFGLVGLHNVFCFVFIIGTSASFGPTYQNVGEGSSPIIKNMSSNSKSRSQAWAMVVESSNLDMVTATTMKDLASLPGGWLLP